MNDPVPVETPAEPVDDPVPAATEADVWQRFWARQIDSTLFLLVTGFAVGIAIAIVDPSLLDRLPQGRLGEFVLSWLLFPVAMLVDAMVYSVAGNTPGKALMGLRVVSATGGRLSFAAYARRNLGVWFFGLGTGAPLVVLVTLVNSHSTLKSGETLRWDAQADTRVVAESEATWRLVVGICLGVVLKAASFLLQAA